MEYIRLTQKDGEFTYVNGDFIREICPNRDKIHTDVVFDNCHAVICKETPEEILKKLRLIL